MKSAALQRTRCSPAVARECRALTFTIELASQTGRHPGTVWVIMVGLFGCDRVL